MATAPVKLHKELEKLFGPDDSPTVQSFYIKQLLRLAWSGKACSEGLRPLCWRVFLGIISSTDKSLWKSQLLQQTVSYASLKERILPSLDKVKVDPLSMLSTGDGQSEEWNSYYKSVELSNFIKGDLDRLYLTGIEEDGYFQTKNRRAMLLSVLFVWSLQNTSTSYRQGMHEIVGCILFVVESERLEWEKAVARKEVSVNHSLHGAFSEQTIEAHTYYIFERIMMELQPLYDPVLTRSHGVESQPFVVQFCTKVQEHYLRILDPDLCSLLEESYVQSQLYGLRWSRLMLGREFLVTHEQLYVLWDYMFACSFDAENNQETSVSDLMDHDAPTNVYSVLANSRLLGNLKNKNINLRETSGAENKFTYVITPLIGSLGDFMLAMLLQIRNQLMDSDASSVMGYLMHYPEMESVSPIIELVDMIRRGVILQDGVVCGAVRSAVNPSEGGGYLDPLSPQGRRNSRGGGRPPSWLLSSTSSSNSSLRGVGKQMSDKFSAVKSAMGSGINALVDTVIEATSEQNHSDLLAATAAPGDAQAPQGKSKTVNGRRGSVKEPVTATASNSGSAGSAVVVDVDPLTGLAITKSSTSSSTSSSIPVGIPVEDSHSTTAAPPLPQPTGLGTGYGNIGGGSSGTSVSKRDPLDDPFSVPVTPAKSSTSSLFAPTSWFPSASSSSSVSKHDKRKASRASGGVDLHTLQTNIKEADESLLLLSTGGSSAASNASSVKSSLFGLSSSSMKNGVSLSAAKSSALANNNSVGDRLLDIADQLVLPTYKTYHPELQYEEQLRTETVKRLRALADVIAGLSSIVDYDMQFANAKLSAPPVGSSNTDTEKAAVSFSDLPKADEAALSASSSD